MTFTDMITYPSKPRRSSSVGNDLDKKDQLRKLKRLNTSILNIFSRYRQTRNFEGQNTNEESQQRNCFLHPSSIITTSELSRSISNKSITFALVFDELENENVNEDKQVIFNLDKSEENEDLIIVVPNKYVNNEPGVKKSNTNTEPYPFRSEVPTCLLPKCNTSHSKKKLLHHFIPYYRRKKVRHPVKTIQSINKIDRSNSAPETLCSLLSSTRTETKSKKDHGQPSKPPRRRFKLPSFNRFLRSFTKHSNGNTKQPKEKSRLKSATSRKYSEMIY